MSAKKHHGDGHKESLLKKIPIKKFFRMGVYVAVAGATLWTGLPEVAAAGVLLIGINNVFLQKQAAAEH